MTVCATATPTNSTIGAAVIPPALLRLPRIIVAGNDFSSRVLVDVSHRQSDARRLPRIGRFRHIQYLGVDALPQLHHIAGVFDALSTGTRQFAHMDQPTEESLGRRTIPTAVLSHLPRPACVVHLQVDKGPVRLEARNCPSVDATNLRVAAGRRDRGGVPRWLLG